MALSTRTGDWAGAQFLGWVRFSYVCDLEYAYVAFHLLCALFLWINIWMKRWRRKMNGQKKSSSSSSSIWIVLNILLIKYIRTQLYIHFACILSALNVLKTNISAVPKNEQRLTEREWMWESGLPVSNGKKKSDFPNGKNRKVCKFTTWIFGDNICHPIFSFTPPLFAVCGNFFSPFFSPHSKYTYIMYIQNDLNVVAATIL